MANFELKKKTVMLRASGSVAILGKGGCYKRKVKITDTFLQFFEKICKLNIRHRIDELHVMAVSDIGRKKNRFALTATIKEFIELNYKGPSKCGYYCVKISKKGTSKSQSRSSSGRCSSTSYPGRVGQGQRQRDVEVVDLDMDVDDVVDQILNPREGDDDVGGVAEEANGDLEDQTEEETLPIVSPPSTKSSKASEEANGNRGRGTSTSMKNGPSTGSSLPASLKNENSGHRESGMGMGPPEEPQIKCEKKHKKRREHHKWDACDAESMLDLNAEGIEADRDLRPIVKRNTAKIGNSTLLRVRAEMRGLQATKIQDVAMWDKVADRAPHVARYIMKVFSEAEDWD